MSENSFGSIPDITSFDQPVVTREQPGPTHVVFRGRNTVSLSALKKVDIRLHKELIAALREVGHDIPERDLELEKCELTRCRSSPAIYNYSTESMNISHGTTSGFSALGSIDPPTLTLTEAGPKSRNWMKLMFMISFITVLFVAVNYLKLC